MPAIGFRREEFRTVLNSNNFSHETSCFETHLSINILSMRRKHKYGAVDSVFYGHGKRKNNAAVELQCYNV
jgi:hypothetical protein